MYRNLSQGLVIATILSGFPLITRYIQTNSEAQQLQRVLVGNTINENDDFGDAEGEQHFRENGQFVFGEKAG